MKFDVVIGNPPYQGNGNNGSHGIWQDFFAKATSCLNDTGVCAFITPHWHTWSNGATAKAIGIRKSGDEYIRKSSTDYDIFKLGKITELHIFDTSEKSKYFSVGSTICWYIYNQQPKDLLTNVTQHYCGDKYVTRIDFSKIDYIPWLVIPELIAIYDKFLKNGMFNVYMDHQTINIPAADYRDVSDNEYQYKWIYSAGKNGAKFRYIKQKSNNYHKWKLLIPISAARSAYRCAMVETNCNQSQDLVMMLFDDKESAIKVKTLINTPIYCKLLAINSQTSKHAKVILPFIDLTTVSVDEITDNFVYRYFGITQEEIDYIEAIVK